MTYNDKAKELLKTTDTIKCFMSDISYKDAIHDGDLCTIYAFSDLLNSFIDTDEFDWKFVVPVTLIHTEL